MTKPENASDGAAFRYNDDLLMDEANRADALARWPEVACLLDFADLRDAFRSIDTQADEAKRQSQKRGLVAIAAGVVALLIAAFEPLYHGAPSGTVRFVSIASALLGTIGVIVGFFGIMMREKKNNWLINRLKTERLRQYYFQSFLSSIPQIVDVARGGDELTFKERRKSEFARFKSERIDVYQIKDVRDLTAGNFDEHVWLQSSPDSVATDYVSGLPESFFSAYEVQRFGEQIAYADSKVHGTSQQVGLSKTESFFSTVSIAAILFLFAIHMSIAIGGLTLWEGFPLQKVHVAAISVALIALAIRAAEEGLQPARELERYERYASDVRWLRQRYQSAASRETKVSIITEMERLSFAEMVSFLRVHSKSKFVL